MDTTVPEAGPAASTRRLAAPIAALRDVTALLLIAELLACGAMAVWVGRPLYADGAFYLFALLNDPTVTAWAWTRDGANVITQVPVILAMRAGVSDITWLARIYGAALYAPPLLAYAATTWLSRRDPHLFVGNAVFVVACFFPISIFIVGEFQILYALFWCGFVLLITGNADRPLGSAIVLALAFGMADTYAISVLLCPLTMLAALWRIHVTDSRVARRILILAMVPLAAGTVIGALGILLTRDPGNEGQFLHALLRFHRNVTLLGLCGLLGLTAVATRLHGSARRAAAAATAVACLLFGWELTRLNHGPVLGDTYTVLGDSYSERAQIVPIVLAVAVVCLFDAWRKARTGIAPRWRFVFWPLLVPALMVVALDLYASFGWRSFLQQFCTVLADERRNAAAFLGGEAAQTYGWRWTYPTLSVLLRPADSTAMVRNPDPQQWQPFDPDDAPDLDRYKTRGGMCRLVGQGA